jgi:hypothetical protein
MEEIKLITALALLGLTYSVDTEIGLGVFGGGVALPTRA